MSPALTYILGAGRSGSTVLERLLGSASGAVAVGEVHCLWRLPLAELTCSCGAPGPECSFWQEVRARASLDLDRLAALSVIEDMTISHRTILGHGGGLARFTALPEVQHFNAMQEDLFGAIAEVAGASMIIDSSKAAPRAWALGQRTDTEIIHLTRHPGAVIASWRSEKYDPGLNRPMRQMRPVSAAADWARAEMSSRLLSKQRRILPLRYEAFTDDPRAALTAILVKDRTDALAWTGPRSFRPNLAYHSLNGNPDRFEAGEIEIRKAHSDTKSTTETRAAA